MPTTDPKLQLVDTSLETNVEYLNRALGVHESFDMICRRLHYAGRDFALYFVDGLAKDDIMNRIMDSLAKLRQGSISADKVKELIQTQIAYLEVEAVTELDKIVASVLSGPLVLLIDGESAAILIDARTYPARGPEEPDTERVVRGARDGFTETIVFNTSLTRRRVRDPNLRFEYLRVGKRSKTDICLAYIKDIANPDLIDLLRNELNEIDVDGLPMAEKTVEELVFKNIWHPYPMIRYTERPDVAAVHLLEGHVLIYVDTSPSVMITPTTFFHHLQHAEEYRQKPVVGAYLLWIRYIAILLSLIAPPLWLALVKNPEWLPQGLKFIVPQDLGGIPVFLQLILAEIGIDVLRMAAIHTPSPLATAMGLVAAIILGGIAVETGFFIKQVVLYIAIAAVGNYATPSYEFALANRLSRLFLLVITALFGMWGFVIGVVLWFVLLATTRSLNVPYLWPLVPFNGKALLHALVRAPVLTDRKRPSILQPRDNSKK